MAAASWSAPTEPADGGWRDIALARVCLAGNMPGTSAIKLMLTVVIFHAGNSLSLPTVATQSTGADADLTHGGMVDLAFRSATLFHPNCRKVLLTDEMTEFAEL